ncbi:hypothetical protein H4R24_002970 [Coemansia sp. RSA 988]|nr:hypothetical protein H4R24_002970 [Coemansia sp. RSA 988]
MAGGRRRRRSSASSNASKSSLNTTAKNTLRPPPPSLRPENADTLGDNNVKTEAVHSAITSSSLARLTANDTDDPFAYDSELDTLSTVSSRSSISSSNDSLLEQALGLSADDDLRLRQSSSEAGDSIPRAESVAEGPSAADQQSLKSADMAIHREDMVGSSNDDTSGSDKHGLETSTVKGGEGRKRRTAKSEESKAASRSKGVRPCRSLSSIKKETTRHGTRRNDNTSDSSAVHSNDSDNMELAHQEAPVSSTISENDEAGDSYVGDAAETTVAGDDTEAQQPKSGDAAKRSSKGSSVEEDEDAVADEARRSAALTELTNIEIDFAQLRERLYCERLQQVQIEEDYLLSGQHAEYERSVEELSHSYTQQLEKLRFEHEAWLEQREHLHQSWIRTVNYTSLVQRQELRRRMIYSHQRRIWRLRDKRIQEDQRYADRVSTRHGAGAVDEDIALIAQQSSESLQQHRHARRVARTFQRCMVHSRKQRLAVPGLDAAEMDADYAAMDLPVYPRESQTKFRRIFVPPLASEPNQAAGKKRKPRQPRQPRKKPALEKGRSAGGGGDSSTMTDTSRTALLAVSPKAADASPLANSIPARKAASPGFGQARTNRLNGQHSAVTSPTRILQALPPVAENVPPAPTALSKSAQRSASPPSITSATTVVASASIMVSGEKKQNSSSSERNARSSVDMHVPSSNSGALGLKV